MYQKLVAVGRLGADPQLRYTPDGTPVCGFSVAVNERRGNGRDVTTWLKVSAWRKLGETCAQYLSKGRLVLVEGRLTAGDDGHPRIWQGSDGPRADFEVEAAAVRFLDAGQQPRGAEAPAYVAGEFAGAGEGERPYGPGGGEPPLEGPALEDEGEIPF